MLILDDLGSELTTPLAQSTLYEVVNSRLQGGKHTIISTNLSMEQVESGLNDSTVQKQLELLRLRSSHPAFGFDSTLEIGGDKNLLTLKWTNGEHWAKLSADLAAYTYEITKSEA